MSKILVLGCAGFIGYELSCRLMDDGHEVTGVDNLNGYYDPKIKQKRMADLTNFGDGNVGMNVHVKDITCPSFPDFIGGDWDQIVHLAAQPGVRASTRNPYECVDINGRLMVNALQTARNADGRLKSIVYASSSSVHGSSTRSTSFAPESVYAATKVFSEALACAYYKSYGIKSVGLRFYTVYGHSRFGSRPDMAYSRFANALRRGEPLYIFGSGAHTYRDFTYIDDTVDAIIKALGYDYDGADHFDIGTGESHSLLELAELIARNMNCCAVINWEPAMAGDVKTTLADPHRAISMLGWRPLVPFADGIDRFVKDFIKRQEKEIG
jgi:UDP-glucuronate 4-epimerase